MKRSTLVRRTPLRASAGLSRTTPLQPVSRRQRARLKAYVPVRAAALERDGHACVVCGSTFRLDVHHRAGRGSHLLDLDLLVTLCRVHHDEAHASPEAAYASGLLVRRTR